MQDAAASATARQVRALIEDGDAAARRLSDTRATTAGRIAVSAVVIIASRLAPDILRATRRVSDQPPQPPFHAAIALAAATTLPPRSVPRLAAATNRAGRHALHAQQRQPVYRPCRPGRGGSGGSSQFAGSDRPPRRNARPPAEGLRRARTRRSRPGRNAPVAVTAAGVTTYEDPRARLILDAEGQGPP